MTIAECFHGRFSWHGDFNLQGLALNVMADYGGKREKGTWVFPDESHGEWREVESWPDGTSKSCFVALSQQVEEVGDGLE